MIFLEKIKLYIPGILVCAAIALGCTFLGQAFPLIGGPVFGILAGMAIALVWKRRDRTSQGITFTSKKILQYAVILLGFGLNLAEVVRVGAQSLPVIVSTIATALIVAFVLCKALHIPERIATLVGVGSLPSAAARPLRQRRRSSRRAMKRSRRPSRSSSCST